MYKSSPLHTILRLLTATYTFKICISIIIPQTGCWANSQPHISFQHLQQYCHPSDHQSFPSVILPFYILLFSVVVLTSFACVTTYSISMEAHTKFYVRLRHEIQYASSVIADSLVEVYWVKRDIKSITYILNKCMC